jgi:hypothetical protein
LNTSRSRIGLASHGSRSHEECAPAEWQRWAAVTLRVLERTVIPGELYAALTAYQVESITSLISADLHPLGTLCCWWALA